MSELKYRNIYDVVSGFCVRYENNNYFKNKYLINCAISVFIVKTSGMIINTFRSTPILDFNPYRSIVNSFKVDCIIVLQQYADYIGLVKLNIPSVKIIFAERKTGVSIF